MPPVSWNRKHPCCLKSFPTECATLGPPAFATRARDNGTPVGPLRISTRSFSPVHAAITFCPWRHRSVRIARFACCMAFRSTVCRSCQSRFAPLRANATLDMSNFGDYQQRVVARRYFVCPPAWMRPSTFSSLLFLRPDILIFPWFPRDHDISCITARISLLIQWHSQCFYSLHVFLRSRSQTRSHSRVLSVRFCHVHPLHRIRILCSVFPTVL